MKLIAMATLSLFLLGSCAQKAHHAPDGCTECSKSATGCPDCKDKNAKGGCSDCKDEKPAAPATKKKS